VVLKTKNSVIVLLFSCVFAASCDKKTGGIPIVPINVETMPMLHAENVTAFLSDSGYTRYKVVAKIWDSYSNKDNPHWHFPEKIYVEQYDTLFHVVGHLKADTAYFFERQNLWKLIGNVYVINIEGTTLETSELFWSQNAPHGDRCAIRVDKSKFVKITRINGDFWTGYGLCSDQAMNDPRIYSIGGEITYTERADSLAADSVKQAEKEAQP
jgi:hypothetical protein